MKKIVPFLILAVVFTIPGPAFAQDNIWDKAESEDYGSKAVGMLGRGVINVATCFVDVIVHTVEGTKEGEPFVGTLTGLGSGIACTALRVSSGALDVVTFWVPDFNGFPVSRSYSDCLDFEETQAFPKKSITPSRSTGISAPSSTVIRDTTPTKKDHDPLEYVRK